MRRGKLGKDEHVKTKATKFERKIAKDYGGRAVPGSGAFDSRKGDVKIKGFLFDSKQTACDKGIYLSGTMLSKIVREANEEGCYPGLIATIEKAPFGVTKSWAVIPLHILSAMLDELQQLREK